MIPQDLLDWFAKKAQETKNKGGIVWDFAKPLPRKCSLCGYPTRSGPDSLYKLKIIDCPEHMPPHWKFHERQALKEAYGE